MLLLQDRCGCMGCKSNIQQHTYNLLLNIIIIIITFVYEPRFSALSERVWARARVCVYNAW